MSRLTRDGTAEPSRETKFSGANADREMFIFPVHLTTSRIGNLTWLTHTLAICVTIPYIHISNYNLYLVLFYTSIFVQDSKYMYTFASFFIFDRGRQL